MGMNTKDLIKEIADHTGLSQVVVKQVLAGLADVLPGAVVTHNDVTITGVGKFKAHVREARDARNPRTGEIVRVPEVIKVKFVAAKAISDELNR